MRGNRLWAAIAAAVIVAVAAIWYFAGFAIPFTNSGPTVASLQPLGQVGSNGCQTFAPDGWGVAEVNANSTVFDVVSLDRSMRAGYAIVLVHGPVARGANGHPGTPPEEFVKQMAMVLTHAPIESTTDSPKFGSYQVLTLTSGNYGGYVLYHVFALEGDKDGYGVVMRTALGSKVDKKSIGLAGVVAAAIQCPVPAMPVNLDTTAFHSTGTSASCREGNCNDADLAGAYSAQFGTGWVHDSSGRNYAVDVDDYNDEGPDGAGYYAVVDGTRQKLDPGLQ
jgi:hypothetical protein